jgi:threonyl-tRNA synthetase
MKLQQIRKISKTWQKKLGLEQWKISVVWGKTEDMNQNGEVIYGLNVYDANNLESVIHIRKEDHDYENTVIHELLHLFLFPLESAAGFSIKQPTDQWETTMEQTINKLTKVIKETSNGRTEG